MLLEEKIEARIALLKKEKSELKNINRFKSYLAKKAHCKKIEEIDQSLGELEKFQQFQVNQRVNDSIHSGTVIQLDVTNGGLPQVWVAWDDYFTVPELPRRLQICSLSLIYTMELKPEVECKALPKPPPTVVTVRTSDIPTSPPMPTWETCQDLPLISLLLHPQSGTRAENGKTQPTTETVCLQRSSHKAAPLEESSTDEVQFGFAHQADILILLGGDEKNPRKSSSTLTTEVKQKVKANDEVLETDSLNPRKITPPSKISPRKNRRRKGEGNGSIYYRTVSKNGKEYADAYYHWQENDKKRTKYIPKKFLSKVKEAELQKLPVADILFLLGGDEKDPRKSSSTLTTEEVLETDSFNPRKITPPSKKRRKQGYGAGYIECKPINRSGKEYKQYWYHYEIWDKGDCLEKNSRYIPKRLQTRVGKLEAEKAPVSEILKLLGVKK